MVDTKTLEAVCHCRAVHFTATVPLSALPLPVHLCHCSMCRYRSGAPCVFHTHIDQKWPIEFVASHVDANLAEYDTSGVKSWHFCSTCGCHIGSKYSDGSWTISTSIFTDHGKENFQIKKYKHSRSTHDGGLAACLDHGRSVEDWNPDKAEGSNPAIMPETDQNGTERLRAQCHCGGVSFTLGRPTEEHINDPFHRRYVPPLDTSKWLATWDVCDDCRLVNGTHVIGWTFIPVSSIEPPIFKDLAIGTSKTYVSSEGVIRSFCGTCGATIFFSCDERCPSERTQVIDIATGILRPPEGAMAREWLTWRPRLAHAQSGSSYDGDFCAALKKGMENWTENQYGQKYGEDFATKLNRDI